MTEPSQDEASGAGKPSTLSPQSSRSPQPQSPRLTPQTSRDRAAHRMSLSSVSSHRQSISDSIRGMPSSPRAPRHNSVTQELWNNPPLAHAGENPYAGRDWKTIRVGEIIDPEQVYFAELDTSVEDATQMLVHSGSPNVILVRDNPGSSVAMSTFDYSDLNAYLLLVVGLAQPDAEHISSFDELARRGREGKPVPLKDIQELGKKDPMVSLPHTAYLSDAVERFGSGIHRIIIVREGSLDTVGILTQLRLTTFFWEFGKSFPAIEKLYTLTLRDLHFGSRHVVSINGDRPLSDALELMNNESITSLPVLDHQRNVVGNISHVDVRLLTNSAALPLLRQSCIHFISVILSERGMTDGKDSFPVFYVSLLSSLAHTTAKLVATRSHRMWIVSEPNPNPTPSPSAPVPPSPIHVTAPPAADTPSPTNAKDGPPYAANSSNHQLSSQVPGQVMSGRLCGVISLTDVLNHFARASGLRPHDPDEARRRRRNSSSSSMRAVSVDSSRSSTNNDITRSSSISARR